MGTIDISEGVKNTLAFEYATKKELFVFAYIASGGIRVNEGALALFSTNAKDYIAAIACLVTIPQLSVV